MFSIFDEPESGPATARQVSRAMTPPETALRGRPHTPRHAPADAGCVLFDRRDRAFWRREPAPRSVVLRDPYFALDLDTGNS